eukprot:2947150-Alexandrium_andersonii.AAC.1
MEMFCKDLGLGDYGGTLVCGLCWADRTGCQFNDFSRGANWRQSAHDLASFAGRHLGPTAHPALRCTGMCCYSVGFDTLHVVDNKGVAGHALAN